MSGFLDHLVRKIVEPQASVRPRPRSRFESSSRKAAEFRETEVTGLSDDPMRVIPQRVGNRERGGALDARDRPAEPIQDTPADLMRTAAPAKPWVSDIAMQISL